LQLFITKALIFLILPLELFETLTRFEILRNYNYFYLQSFSTKALSTKALVGCMSSRHSQGHGMHIWEFFDRFYCMKHGRQFNKQPSMMLSEAFAMDVGCTQQTPKQVRTIIYYSTMFMLQIFFVCSQILLTMIS